MLLPHDYVNFLLTGKKWMEAGDASESGAFDVRKRDFGRALLAWVDERAPGFFPELVQPDVAAGIVSAQAAEYFGLPEGILVSPGGGDNMMSAIGSGATREGVTVISLGTAYSSTPTSFRSRILPIIEFMSRCYCASKKRYDVFTCER